MREPDEEPRRPKIDWRPGYNRKDFKLRRLLEDQYREKIPTLDELLDKINCCGLESLTNKEMELLNKYSK
jgi:hypothetical protein